MTNKQIFIVEADDRMNIWCTLQLELVHFAALFRPSGMVSDKASWFLKLVFLARNLPTAINVQLFSIFTISVSYKCCLQ